MGPPGDSSRGCRTDGSHSCEELQKEPIPQNDEGRDGNEEDKNERQHPGSWIKNDVGAHDPGYGATGTEGGQGGVEIKNDVR